MTSLDDVAQRLELFQEMRLGRVATSQILSNPAMYGPEKRDEAIRKFYQGPLPPVESPPFSAPMRDLTHSYNVFEEAEKAMQRLPERQMLKV